MGRIFCICILSLSVAVSLSAQTSSPNPAQKPPQSARQALIEMFLAKDDEAFIKHLPDDAKKALIHAGETSDTSMILKFATLGREFTKPNDKTETFDTGALILTSALGERERVEVNVERDSLMGENDEIELSIHYLKDGQQQAMVVIPDLIFTFRQEKEVWKLVELTAAAHFPLTDPDYLKGLRKQQNDETEQQARNRMNVIAGAEMGYMGKHPDRGYSCSLTALFAPEPDADPNEIVSSDPGQGEPQWYGYSFSLAGCEGNPPSKFQVLATPLDTDGGLQAFCTDQAGTLKSIASARASNCFKRGKPVSDPTQGTD